MYPHVLSITHQGLPQSWLSVEEAASNLVAGRVLYAFGDTVAILRGGYNQSGARSVLDIPAIITTRASHYRWVPTRPALTRTGLFARDGYLCLYCGQKPVAKMLTVDHILPRSRGGRHTWNNTCAACESCNLRKGARTPEEAGMQLLGVPYEPNVYEHLFLQNRRVVADQMRFLAQGFRTLVI